MDQTAYGERDSQAEISQLGIGFLLEKQVPDGVNGRRKQHHACKCQVHKFRAPRSVMVFLFGMAGRDLPEGGDRPELGALLKADKIFRHRAVAVA